MAFDWASFFGGGVLVGVVEMFGWLIKMRYDAKKALEALQRERKKALELVQRDRRAHEVAEQAKEKAKGMSRQTGQWYMAHLRLCRQILRAETGVYWGEMDAAQDPDDSPERTPPHTAPPTLGH
jgi:hypothetical protein